MLRLSWPSLEWILSQIYGVPLSRPSLEWSLYRKLRCSPFRGQAGIVQPPFGVLPFEGPLRPTDSFTAYRKFTMSPLSWPSWSGRFIAIYSVPPLLAKPGVVN